jgi:hypothetical protein
LYRVAAQRRRPGRAHPSTPLSSSLPAVLRAVLAAADDAAHVPSTPVLAPTVLCDGALFWRQ